MHDTDSRKLHGHAWRGLFSHSDQLCTESPIRDCSRDSQYKLYHNGPITAVNDMETVSVACARFFSCLTVVFFGGNRSVSSIPLRPTHDLDLAGT